MRVTTTVCPWRMRRLGLVRFAPHQGLDLAGQDNKDAVLFPEPVRAPDGRRALALIHRPTFPAAFAERVRRLHAPLEPGVQAPPLSDQVAQQSQPSLRGRSRR